MFYVILPPQYMNSVWVPGEKQRTKASFLSSKALDCVVPSLSNTAVHTEDFMMDDKPYARWEIKVNKSNHQRNKKWFWCVDNAVAVYIMNPSPSCPR